MGRPLEKRLLEEELNNIIQDYQNGLSISKIAKKYKHSSEALSKMLFRLGIKTKIGGECIRKYTFNINKIIEDSPDKYYWLGFISGDGSVGRKEKRLRIEVKNIDRDLLIKFLDFIESNAIIYDRVNNKGCSCCSITINSSELLRYLEKYNIHPNKTYDFEIPLDNIPEEYLWDYIRGLMDADGCIYTRDGRRNYSCTISFVAKNKKCIEQMKDIWNINNKINAYNGAFTIMKEGKEAIAILDKIYKNSSDKNRLDRKYAKYCSIVR